MHYAELMQGQEFVALLQSNGARRDIRNRVGLTANDIKQRRKRKEKAKRDLHKRTLFSEELIDAIDAKDTQAVQSILNRVKNGLDKINLDAQNSTGDTVLMHAAY